MSGRTNADVGWLLTSVTFVALVGTVGSLYFSLGVGLTPCRLCWYQRILMYPLVVVGGVAAIEGRAGAWKTVLPLSVGGTAIAAYHVFLQIRPPAGASCGLGESCTAILYPMADGLLTIPRLSLVGFVLITVLTLGVAAVASDEETQS